MSGKSLREITAEIRANNVARGWRPAEGGPGANTFGDYVALLHTEVAEMTEAYRDWGTADATAKLLHSHADGECSCGLTEAQLNRTMKPEGVGSELADVLIRLLDMCDVFGMVPFDMDFELADVAPIPLRSFEFVSFGDHMAWLHHCAAVITRDSNGALTGFLRALAAIAERYEIDLTAEYERKMAYNRTRPYQHGGRTMAKVEGSA